MLWRQKEAFSDGVSSLKKKSWVEELKSYVDSIISDKEFEEERRLYNPMPMHKDALYLRRLYNKFYGNIQPQLISKYWIPQWTAAGAQADSSARYIKELFNTDDEHKKLFETTKEKEFLKSKIEHRA